MKTFTLFFVISAFSLAGCKTNFSYREVINISIDGINSYCWVRQKGRYGVRFVDETECNDPEADKAVNSCVEELDKIGPHFILRRNLEAMIRCMNGKGWVSGNYTNITV